MHARGAAVADGLGLGLWVGQREGTPQRQGEGGCGDDGQMHFGQWCVGGVGGCGRSRNAQRTGSSSSASIWNKSRRAFMHAARVEVTVEDKPNSGRQDPKEWNDRQESAKLGLDKEKAEVGREDQTTYTYADASRRGMNASVVSLLNQPPPSLHSFFFQGWTIMIAGLLRSAITSRSIIASQKGWSKQGRERLGQIDVPAQEQEHNIGDEHSCYFLFSFRTPVDS